MRPSPEYVRELLHYDLLTGLFYWKIARKGRRLGVWLCNTDKNVYPLIGIDGCQYRAHVVAWVIVNGRWPDHEIDHKDRRRNNTRWANLRPATAQQQRFNTSLRTDNTSGHKGVTRFRNGWRARIYVGRKEAHLGVFPTHQAAVDAYRTAAQKHYGEYAAF
jgi:hypothetical protein